MNNRPLWSDVKFETCPTLKENLSTRVLVIGGGMTGMSALYHLNRLGVPSILVERNICGEGVTSKSTAKINYLQDNTIINISNYRSEAIAKRYLKSQIYATKVLAEIVEKENIPCDFHRVDSYLFTNAKNGTKKLAELKELLVEVDAPVYECENIPFQEPFMSAIKVTDTYVFHPGKYVGSMKQKLKDRIYEHSKVDKIEKVGDKLVASIGLQTVTCDYIILASHYPYFLFPYLFPFKAHIETSYLGAKKVNNFEEYTAINIEKPTKSMRFHSSEDGNYFLYLLNSMTSSDIGDINHNFSSLADTYKFDYMWSNNDVITSDYMPLVGPISDDEKLLIATGYNTWGMTNSTLAGLILAERICGIENEYASLFEAKRGINLSKIVRFPLDITSSLKSYLVSTRRNVNNKNVTYTKIDGIDVAIYTDPDGHEHTVLNRCPHMKCGLVLNEKESTWDCLCHGSRFDLDGRCIEGPANCDITFYKP